jgi:uncharacterized protein (TIGR02231 family)
MLFSRILVVLTMVFVVDRVRAAPATAPTTAPSRVTAVTIYQGSALVTREVAVPQGAGLMELIVSPLPAQTVAGTLYSEAPEGLRILTTRYRTRAVKEDTRAEVRAKEEHIRRLRLDAERIGREIQVIEQNLAMLGKLENFTAATMQHLAEKGLLNGDATIALTKYVMDTRAERSAAQVQLQQQLATNVEAHQFAQRELAELTAGASRTERDAVIVVDKTNANAATVRLNYLVGAANWRPQYKLRAQGEREPVQVEYLAAVTQQSGEDWSDATIVLSTAEPMLSAAPPELTMLDVTVGQAKGQDVSLKLGAAVRDEAQRLREQAAEGYLQRQFAAGDAGINKAAALEQTDELLSTTGPGDQFSEAELPGARRWGREGPSVTYHLKHKFTIPTRNDEQLIEVARLEMSPDFYYKAVPVLTPHVYRLADLTNSSEHVLLGGEATMYRGADFVGRMNLPLVAIGEKFTAAFGADPQLQVTRELLTKERNVQGGNQVHSFRYRIRVSSFKDAPVKLQVWDRLPHAEAEAVGVTLTSSNPPLSTDPKYLREERPRNLLRWDLTVAPDAQNEKSAAIDYEFKLEYDRNMALGNFKAGK